jgi:hypothetical protein
MKAPRVDEWLRVLEQGRDVATDPEGFTAAELIEATGFSSRWIYELLRQWSTNGGVEHVGHRRGLSINGRAKQIPVYRLKQVQPSAAHRAGHGGRAIKGR